MSQISPMTPSLDFPRRTRRGPGSTELQRAPRRRSKGFAFTPKSIRRGTSSPCGDTSEVSNTGTLTPSARGSPVLLPRNSKSPTLCPKTLKSPFGSPLVQRSPSKYQGDRFIPTRSKIDVEQSNFLMLNGSPYNLKSPVLQKQVPTIRVLAFGNGSPKERSPKETSSNIGGFKVLQLKEDKNPERILDAPGVLVNEGNNLLDWSVKNNLVALALDDTVYLWNSITHKTNILCKSTGFAWITAIKWHQKGTTLAISLSDGKIHFWKEDAGVMFLYCTTYCITCLAWNGDVLTYGNMRGQIQHNDLLNTNGEDQYCISAHSFAVTCLSWNRSGELLASGCVDGTVKIWSGKNPPLEVPQEELAEITACRWSPFLNSVLAVGTGNGHLFFWRISDNINLLAKSNSLPPVTDLKWLPTTKGIFSSHLNGDVNFFTYPLLKNVKRFSGHEGSVICITLAPDYQSLMSLGADETLRIWNIVNVKDENVRRSPSPSTLSRQFLR